MKNRILLHRFGFALAGLSWVWQREKSFRTELFFAVLAILLTAVIRPGLIWTALIIISIAIVLALELMNSALEYLIDHLHPQIAPEIKAVKDVASAAVLMANTSAVVIFGLAVCATFY